MLVCVKLEAFGVVNLLAPPTLPGSLEAVLPPLKPLWLIVQQQPIDGVYVLVPPEGVESKHDT